MNAVNGTETMELTAGVSGKLEGELAEMKITNYKIEITPGAGKGDNYLGVIAKISITGIDEAGKKISLNWIAKSAPENEAIKKVLDIDGLYEREVYIYEEIFPLYAKFQDERAVLRPFDFHPTFVFHHLQENCFVMEDLKSIGYIMKDRKKPLDYNHVKLVMEAYGKLHALSFALRDQDPELLRKLAENTPDIVFNRADVPKERAKQHMAMHHKKVLDSLRPEEDAIAIEKYKKYVENDVDIIRGVFDNLNEYCVIGHGDSWVNNMLFKYENASHPDRPTKVCLLDWQLSRYGSPALDLSYFIFTCTDHALREKHYDNMIKFYYHSLCQHLVDLGGDPDELFSFSALQAELKRASILGLYMSIMVVHLMISEVDEIPDLDLADENKLIMSYESVNENLYNARVRGMILDFVKYGYMDF
ncbi:hypothetical protein MML48_2g00006942 [Holotrichia oblita]|uniref:Uncharacterized protein n=1 Tax=Holotrichia oblita TaxID=644536 RepID=A0ACB9TJ82_HOLOL|nr:hypothetical protein MML48_2g00006942 [Holotrichia oblita]